MKYLKTWLLSLLASLLLASSANAKTLIVSVQDMMLEVPNFTNAPSFDFNAALQGSNPVGGATSKIKRKTSREREKEIIALLELAYPEATAIRIYRGNAIITLPDS